MLDSNVMHETTNQAIHVGAHIDYKETIGVHFGDRIRSANTQFKHAAAFLGKLVRPCGHCGQLYSTTGNDSWLSHQDAA
jgi:hypothetical protein